MWVVDVEGDSQCLPRSKGQVDGVPVGVVIDRDNAQFAQILDVSLQVLSVGESALQSKDGVLQIVGSLMLCAVGKNYVAHNVLWNH
jgi:hypothetical protein